MAALPLTGHAIHKSEMEYHGKFGHTLERVRHIAIICRIELCYETYCLSTQTIAPNLPGFQGIKRCVQYLASRQHKPLIFASNSYDVSNVTSLTWSGNLVEDHTLLFF